ncbi:MAG: glycosyltransferase family 4 protein [Nitrospirae bacterium]|nr:glycosyltransferase family 4 protein [Nitrospirota bacterium]MCL5977098.1 glycosyltransferase family 4 protein [Nitrospirota bacterium]
MKKITVAHLLPNYNPFPPLYPAGTELRVEQISVRQQRYRPVVICGAFGDQPLTEDRDGMRIRRIRIGKIYRRLFQKITRLDPMPYTARMWDIISEENAALLHLHNEPKLLSGLARRIERQPMPVIVHIANEKPVIPDNTPLVTRWVACSRFMAEWLKNSYAIPEADIRVIYTGVDTLDRKPLWEMEPAYRRKLRQDFGVEDDNAVVMLFAGRIVREKGVAELLDTFRIVRSRSKIPIYLLVAGNVRETNDPKNEKTIYGRAMVKRMEQEEGVRWIGSLPPQDVHNFLLAGDIFILPSIWNDPFPTVMLEAAAAGLPILGSAKGGIIEFLKGCPGEPLIKEPEKPETWSGHIEKLICDPNLRQQAGHWLRRRVEESFDWSRVTDECEYLYDEIMGAS